MSRRSGPGNGAARRRWDWDGAGIPGWKRALLGLLSLWLAAALWLPCVHLIFRPRLSRCLSDKGVPRMARALAARHLRLWTDPALRQQEIRRMRVSNAEWDFMGRTYLILALANMALRDPAEQTRYLQVMDRILEETLRLEGEKGMSFFLMDYARENAFVLKPPRSLFVDGEIALMLGVRRLVAERADYRALMAQRCDVMLDRMRRGPVLCAESYQDECWMFCNTVALAAMQVQDVLDGTDHSDFFRDWLAMAQRKLVDPRTGLLVSDFDLDGVARDGPRGSTIWMAAHCLQLVYPEFARDQYERAKYELARSVAGFGYAREWPPSYSGSVDVDSGPVIPVLDAGPASSGLAMMAAAAFGDRELFARLCTSLNFAAFPSERDGALHYCASNQVGDAVLLYSTVLGPVWGKAKRSVKP